MTIEVKENDYTCGTCKYYVLYSFFDVKRYCCGIIGQPVSKRHTCDGWEEDKDELSDDEKREIIGDRKAHEIMETEGYVE